MSLPLLQIDAFAEGPFTGNPAAVVLLESPMAEDLMQRIAEENNLSETAFLVPHPSADEGGPDFALRWFTPTTEVELCGHATLAAAEAIRRAGRARKTTLTFATRSGPLVATLEDRGRVTIDLPAATGARPVDAARHAALEHAVDGTVKHAHEHRYVLAELESEHAVRRLAPTRRGLEELGLPLVATARADDGDVDFVSRFFAPTLGVFEDPVTGSAHCQLVPFWAGALGKGELVGRQISTRGGRLECALDGDRVRLTGAAHLYLEGTIQAG